MNPTVARALITELQTNIVTESGFSIDDMLTFAGVMHDVPPDSEGSQNTFRDELSI